MTIEQHLAAHLTREEIEAAKRGADTAHPRAAMGIIANNLKEATRLQIVAGVGSAEPADLMGEPTPANRAAGFVIDAWRMADWKEVARLVTP
jgi:hypothetical protein